MARTLSATISTAVTKSATGPGYLISIPTFSGFPRLNSRSGNVTWDGNTYQGSQDFTVSGLSWDGAGSQKGRIDFNDLNITDLANNIAAMILNGKIAGHTINIYLYYQNAVNLGLLDTRDVTHIFTGMVDTCEISSDGKVSLSITSEQLEVLSSPRRYIKPGPVATGFNWIPPVGTIIVWGSDKLKIEKQ